MALYNMIKINLICYLQLFSNKINLLNIINYISYKNLLMINNSELRLNKNFN
jgi:hypothetical protein